MRTAFIPHPLMSLPTDRRKKVQNQPQCWQEKISEQKEKNTKARANIKR